MFFDTEIERNISIGSDYVFPPMKKGECFVNQEMVRKLGVQKGDVIWDQIDMYWNLRVLIDSYNTQYAIPNNVS